MPNGFRGEHAASYLNKVSEIHEAAVAATNQTAPGAPAGPQVISLPYEPGTAHTGSSTTGYGTSANIVSDQSEYTSAMHDIEDGDQYVGQIIYDSAVEVKEICDTVLIMPATNPKILNVSGEVKQSLNSFMSAVGEMAQAASGFASSITGVS